MNFRWKYEYEYFFRTKVWIFGWLVFSLAYLFFKQVVNILLFFQLFQFIYAILNWTIEGFPIKESAGNGVWYKKWTSTPSIYQEDPPEKIAHRFADDSSQKLNREYRIISILISVAISGGLVLFL